MSKRRADAMGDLGRFSEPALFVLISLADGTRHGYEMLGDIEHISGRRPGLGTLYGCLTRLEERGWIETVPTDDRRRPYKLTPVGHRVLAARIARLKAIAKIGHERLSQS